MRPAILSTLLFLAAIAPAMADQPARAMLFHEECDKLDKKEAGFECRDYYGFQIYIYERLNKLPPERAKKVETAVNRMALRYVELGGQHFTIRYADSKSFHNCWRKKNVSYPDFMCD